MKLTRNHPFNPKHNHEVDATEAVEHVVDRK